jgi:hypothetical protein
MSRRESSIRTDSANRVDDMAADPSVETTQSSQRPRPIRTRTVQPDLAAPPRGEPSTERSLDELIAEQRSTEERWRRALKAANNGRPKDLAELHLAQEAYVAAGAALARARREADEVSRREAVERARRTEAQSRLAVIVAQEQRWHEVANGDGQRGGFLGGIRRVFRRPR